VVAKDSEEIEDIYKDIGTAHTLILGEQTQFTRPIDHRPPAAHA
jgi:hypothetical protein